MSHAAPARWPALRARILESVRNPKPAALIGFGAVVAVVVLVVRGPQPNGPMDVHSLPLAFEELRLGPGGAELRPGLAAYADSDWNHAAELLARAPAEGAADLARRAYLGSAHALAGNPTAATAALEGLPLDELPEPWGSQAQWTLAMALDGVGRHDDSRRLLEHLAERDRTPLAGRARQRLAR
jgi:hypothetical protein